MLLTLLLACPKKGPIEAPVTEGAPVVPAMVAPLYKVSPASPKDPLIAWAMDGRAYDETLAGAAGSLAFVQSEDGGIDEAAVRWALIRAGWPFGFSQVELATVEQERTPALLLAELESVPVDMPVGLVRVRTPQGDTWVMVVAEVPIAMAPFAREADIGDPLALAVDPAGWTRLSQRTLAPSGRIHEGAVVYGEPGEWLVELSGVDASGQGRLLVQVPVYVGEDTPDDGPFLSADASRPSEPEARQQALMAVDVLRDLLGTAGLEVDPVLASVAGTEADRRAQGGAAADQPVRVRRPGHGYGKIVICKASLFTFDLFFLMCLP